MAGNPLPWQHKINFLFSVLDVLWCVPFPPAPSSFPAFEEKEMTYELVNAFQLVVLLFPGLSFFPTCQILLLQNSTQSSLMGHCISNNSSSAPIPVSSVSISLGIDSHSQRRVCDLDFCFFSVVMQKSESVKVLVTQSCPTLYDPVVCIACQAPLSI